MGDYVMNILNSKFYTLLEKVTNLVILNVVFLIFCIPIITIFPAISAMFGVIRESKFKEEKSVLKPFIEQFKINFKKGLLISLLWIPFPFFLYVDYQILLQLQPIWKTAFFIPLVLISFIFLSMSMYLFPIIVHYKLTIMGILKNTFIISLAYFPTTLLLIGIATILFLIFTSFQISIIFILGLWASLNFNLCNTSFEKIRQVSSKTI